LKFLPQERIKEIITKVVSQRILIFFKVNSPRKNKNKIEAPTYAGAATIG
jgi:hypothetical protein